MDNEPEKPTSENNEPSIPSEIEKTQSLLTQLVVLTILIIGLILVVVAYPRLRPRLNLPNQVIPTQRPSGTPVPTSIPTNTSTVTPTLRATLTPTITLTPTPSSTPSETSTPPGPPTLTPARPLPDDNLYSLVEWSPEKADLLVQYMEDYPNTLGEKARGEDNAGYWAAFTYAATALQEALLRFPDAQQADGWRWKLANNLARMDDSTTGEVYADIIVRALNQGKTNLEELPDWFQSNQPEMELSIVETEPPVGAGTQQNLYGSYLLQIDGNGSALLWLVEGPGAFTAFPLAVDFDFVSPTSSQTLLNDLTGDGFDEVVVFPSESERSFELNPPRIFDLSQAPPRELNYQIGDDYFNMGIEFLNHWTIEEDPAGGNILVFEGQTYPACPVIVRMVYKWRNNLFELDEVSYQIEPDMEGTSSSNEESGNLHLCRTIIDHAANTWGPQAAISLMEPLLPDWPPELSLDGKKLSEEASALEKDEWRYRLGVYHALAGNFEPALSYLNDLVSQPSIPGNQWNIAADKFMEEYQAPEDVYRACLESPYCDPSKALSYLGTHIPQNSTGNPIGYLTEKGIQLIASGYEDLDRDGTSEQWFTTRHRPLEPIELWLIAMSPVGQQVITPRVTAMRIGQIDTSKPDWQIIDDDPQNITVQLDKSRQFSLRRQTETLKPVIIWLSPQEPTPNRFVRELNQAEKALFSGESPVEIQNKLKLLADYPGLLCLGTWSCDRYDYLLGLSSELADDSQQAVTSYLNLWRDYLRSPFTIMARLKLFGEALSLVTPSPITSTPTPTPTLTSSYPYPENPYP